MHTTTQTIWTHLALEELESRSMLSALPFSSGSSVTTSANDSPNGGVAAFIGGESGSPAIGNGTLVTSQAGNGTLIGGGFLSDVNTAQMLTIAANENPGLFIGGTNPAGVNWDMNGGLNTLDPTNPLNPRAGGIGPTSPNAADGVGQMTIATGANTLGMGATATAGFYNDIGGGGGPGAHRIPIRPRPTEVALLEAGFRGDALADVLADGEPADLG
ncbi:MAG TPA: hypothetical protein VHV08_02140 [Pirellulales bacterium]|jgi:hypothetical protein|nr:hypothetical protein [Pirellulales bacterium]